jgi:hypothetical protein
MESEQISIWDDFNKVTVGSSTKKTTTAASHKDLSKPLSGISQPKNAAATSALSHPSFYKVF